MWLDSFQAKIDRYRLKINNAILGELNHNKNSTFANPLKHAVKEGKRLRPILLILSYEALDGCNNDPYPAAVAVELVHIESLIHDDVMDDDVLRRKNPAFHIMYGHEVALLSGDFILSMILEITAQYNSLNVAKTLAQAASNMCEGQLQEFKAYEERKTLSLDEYINIISKKTASLFEASATIGALLREAHKDEVKALSNYGRLLGLAYQIQDDITDSKENTKIKIARLLKTSVEIEQLQDISKTYVNKAKQNLGILKQCEAKSLLLELADFVVSPSISRI